jgi:hypothetical protein
LHPLSEIGSCSQTQRGGHFKNKKSFPKSLGKDFSMDDTICLRDIFWHGAWDFEYFFPGKIHLLLSLYYFEQPRVVFKDMHTFAEVVQIEMDPSTILDMLHYLCNIKNLPKVVILQIIKETSYFNL